MPLLFSRYRLGFLLGAVFSLTGCQQKLPASLPQDPLVRVYFNQNPSAEYTEPYRQQKRLGDNLEKVIVDSVADAKYSLDLAVQELRLPQIARSLVERHQAGVKVRVIVENTYRRPLSSLTPAQIAKLPEREQKRYQEFLLLADKNGDKQLDTAEINQSDALIILQNAGVPIVDDTDDGTKGSGLMHHKFVLVDNTKLVVTSANFTTSDIHGDFSSPITRGNPNNLLVIESAQLAALFSQEFNLMWGDGPGGKADSLFGVQKPFRLPQTVMVGSSAVTVQFSPSSTTIPWQQSVNGLIGKTLAGASRSVDMALFVFSEQTLVNSLEVLHQKGVKLRTLIEPSFAYRPYSEALDMMGVALLDSKCRYEPDNRTWQNPITTVGVPDLPTGDLLHHKFGVLDAQTVIAGSHNWSKAANNGNDETLLVIENPTVAAHYVREFDRLYAGAKLGVPQFLQKKIHQQQKQCR